MKKTLFAVPLAFLLVNCSTTRTSTTGNTSSADGTATSSINVPAVADQSTTTPASGTTSANMNTISGTAGVSTSSTMGGNNIATGSMTSDAYHTNNQLLSGNVYNGYYNARAADIAASGTGGWTYNTDMRRNTNYNNAVDGEWTLQMTPEVATAWMPDKNKPEEYASYWTPEAIRARQQTFVSASANMDNRSATSGKKKTTTKGNAVQNKTTNRSGSAVMDAGSNSGMMNSSTSVNGSATMSSNAGSTTGSASMNGTTNGSSTFNMNEAQGFHSSTGTTNADGTMTMNTGMNNEKNMYKATNGNMFMMPQLKLYIENGSFTGYTGCNPIVGSIMVDGTKLRFNNPVPSTGMECSGGFSQAAFLDRISRVDSYEMVNNELRLKSGNETLMVLAKSNSMNNAMGMK